MRPNTSSGRTRTSSFAPSPPVKSKEPRKPVGASADNHFGVVLEERELLRLIRGDKVRGADIRVADNPNRAANTLQSFTRQLKERGIEVARDAVVADRADKSLRQEAPP